MTCKNHFLFFNIGTYFGFIIVLFNYAFSTAEVNTVSNDMGTSLSLVCPLERLLNMSVGPNHLSSKPLKALWDWRLLWQWLWQIAVSEMCCLVVWYIDIILAECAALVFTVKMEAACFIDTLDIYQTIWCCMPRQQLSAALAPTLDFDIS